MNNKVTVDTTILAFAFRYALGRMSAAPLLVTDNIKKNIEDLANNDIERFIKEITECNYFGDDHDKQSWFAFKEYLEEELEKRVATVKEDEK